MSKPPRRRPANTPSGRDGPRHRYGAVRGQVPGEAAILDVAVIGGGLSGLVTAWHLQRGGRQVRVFEGRGRTGGRAFTPIVGGHPVDLGATWVWDGEDAVHGLLRALQIDCPPHHDSGWDLYDAEGGVRRVTLPRSAVAERRISGGAQAITDALTARVSDVAVDAPVRSLSFIPGGVAVQTDGETVSAAHVVAALPPKLLADSVILEGVGSDRVALWRHTPVWMADVAKVVIVFPERFWADAGGSGRVASVLGPMVEIHDLSGPGGNDPAALFGFVPRSLARGPDLEGRVRRQLSRLFGADGASPIAIRIAAWWEEAMTWPGGEENGNPRLFGHPVLREPALGGRLHLVSTETSGIRPGHLDGAVERGVATAAGLLAG